MDHNGVNGTIDEFVGITKQKTGELTGNTQIRIEGTVQQATGKVKAVGPCQGRSPSNRRGTPASEALMFSWR